MSIGGGHLEFRKPLYDLVTKEQRVGGQPRDFWRALNCIQSSSYLETKREFVQLLFYYDKKETLPIIFRYYFVTFA